MPIRMEVKTSGPAFPDQGTTGEYIAALAPVRAQIDAAISDFATHRIDRKTPLTDASGQPCGEIEILRF